MSPPASRLESSRVRVVASALGLAVATVVVSVTPAVPASAVTVPSWKVQTTPDVRMASASLSAASCPSLNWCMVVGESSKGLSERWNGARWLTIPMPAFPGGSASSADAIACTAPDACLAVGELTVTGGNSEAASWSWNGRSWTAKPVPLQPGEPYSYLDGVSCEPDAACMAVGGAYGSDYATSIRVVAATWNGTAWRIESPGASGAGFGGSAVACRQGLGCLVDADDLNNPGTALRIYFWNFKKWTDEAIVLSSDVQEAELTGIACPTNSFCVTDGSQLAPNMTGGGIVVEGLSYVWGGRSWTQQQMPIEHRSPVTQFESVHCASPTYCLAAGTYQTRVVQKPGLAIIDDGAAAEIWNGKGWSVSPVPVPARAASSEFLDVRCVTSSHCLAVGAYETSDGDIPRALSDSWDGKHWTVLAPPSPVVALPTYLNAVSCVRTRACSAVGFYQDDQENPAAESWNGSKWSLTPVPVESGLGGALVDVSCATGFACQAVGLGAPGHDPEADSWNGRNWTTRSVPAPPQLFASVLDSVSCVTPSDCLAVGEYLSTTSSGPLVEHWNGSKWEREAPPRLPKGFLPDLAGVDCVASNRCVVVGAEVSTTSAVPMVAVWNGTTWSLPSVPAVSGAQAILEAVSCASSTVCVAVGTSIESSSKSLNLSESLSGSKWVRDSVPNLSSGHNLLGTISCPSARSCMANGATQSAGAASPRSVIETWNGSSWTPSPLPEPSAGLSGVSCVAPGACMVVGAGPNGLAFSATEGSV